jgi:hypothetical protein
VQPILNKRVGKKISKRRQDKNEEHEIQTELLHLRAHAHEPVELATKQQSSRSLGVLPRCQEQPTLGALSRTEPIRTRLEKH